MNFYGFILVCFAVCITACHQDTELESSQDLQEIETVSVLSEYFSAYQVIDLDPALIYQEAKKAKDGGQIEFTLPNGQGAAWTVVVSKDPIFDENFVAIEYSAQGKITHDLEMIALVGFIKETGADVKFVSSPENFGGVMQIGEELYYLDPMSFYEVENHGHSYQCVFYKEEHALIKEGFTCGTNQSSMISTEETTPTIVENRDANCWKLQIRCHGDYEHFVKYNRNYNTAVYAISLNFSQSEPKFGLINLDYNILEIAVFTSTSNSLYYPTSWHANTLLNQTQYMWNHNPNGRDLAILFTGKNTYFQGSDVIGLAFVKVICNVPTASYAVVETGLTGHIQRNCLAHEIGHTLGADHTNSGLMMETASNSNQSFSTTSKNQMNNHIWFNNGCLHQSACL